MMYSHSPQTVFKFSYLQLQDKSSSIILPSGVVLSVSAQSLYYLPHVNSYSVILMMLTNTSSTHLQKQKILPGFFPLTFRIQETTLEEVMLDQLKKENINNEIGACVFFKSFGLRIAKKSDGKFQELSTRAIH